MFLKKFKNTRPCTSMQIGSQQNTKSVQVRQLDSSKLDPNAILTDEVYPEFVQQILNAHNEYRRTHGVEPLTLKDEINKFSQKYANTMAKKKEMKHSKKSDRPNYGENLYYTSLKYIPGNMVVDSWYSEAEQNNYQYGKEPKDLRSGHFTQVVWKNSKYLGVGAKAWEKGLFVVCNYEPAGNVIGHFSENVPPPLQEEEVEEEVDEEAEEEAEEEEEEENGSKRQK